MQFEISGTIVSFVGINDATEQEAKNYIEYIKQKVKLKPQEKVAFITIVDNDDGSIDLDYQLQGPKFERIRLSGSLETWNDSKRAEERDRVKHAAFN